MLITLSSIYIIYRLARSHLNKRRHDRLALALGCKPAKRWKTRDPFLGLDFFHEQYKALKAGNVIAMMADRFTKLGRRTARFDILGMHVIVSFPHLFQG